MKFRFFSNSRRADLALTPSARIQKWGHRQYVGGMDAETWYSIGKRQYHFLVEQGLTADKIFLDIACGSLRLGQFLIPMLETGKYYGLEGEQSLIDAGIAHEVMFDLVAKKEAKLACNYNFDLSFCDGYDYAIAQSLFTHLTLKDITRCFTAMRSIGLPGSSFFFTFFEGDELNNPTSASHANKDWCYEYKTLEKIVEKAGFQCRYIGDWGHERNQMMAVASVPD